MLWLDRLSPAGRLAGVWRSFWPAHRIRRPIDVARLPAVAAASLALVVLAAWSTRTGHPVPRLAPELSADLPRAAVSVVNVTASLAVLLLLAAVAVDAVRTRRFSLTSAAIATPLGLLLALGAASVAELAGGEAATDLLLGPRNVSAGLPVTAAVAFLVGADLQRRRWRVPTRVAIATEVACALFLGSLGLVGAAYAVLLGTTAGLAVRALVGVVPARPPEELVRAVLAGAGHPPVELRPLHVAAGRIRYTAVDRHGEVLRVTVVDPDRRGVTLARRAWRVLRFRTAAVGRPALSLRGELERRALTAALAEAAGMAAPRVLALLPAGPALVLLERPLAGQRLAAVDGAAAAAGARAAWAALRRLHAAGLAHGALSTETVVLLPDGTAGFGDLGAAQPAATDLQRDLDVVALLAATATILGAPEAVAAMRAGYGPGATSEGQLAALVQPIALPDRVRRSVRRTPLLGELRAALAGDGAAAAPVPPPRLERLRPRTVLTVAAATLAVHILATQLSTVSIGDALRSARPGWLAVALLGSALTYLGSALVLRPFVHRRLGLTRTALVQLASSFLDLVTPPAVAHVGLNVRYLQRSGVPVPEATASVAVKETVTILVTVPIVLVCGWLSGVSASRLTLLPSGDVLTVLLVTAGVLGLVALLPPARRALQRRLAPLIRRTLPQLLAAVSSPRRLVPAVLGVVVLDGANVLAMDASLRAFSASLAIPSLVVVYFAASTLGSAAPTPGGLGAVEAALVGGLTETGVPVAAALTSVLVFRTATFWLPAPVGWGAFVAAQRRGWI